MSTIKSSAENLTLNADGSGNDIKFQSNGVEKASISDAGLFTSTTIDATKLTGNLPAISGASLTSVNAVNGGRKNMVINGNMQVAQRATSLAGYTAGGYLTLDRYRHDKDSSTGTFTMTQQADAPDGFKNSLKVDCTTAGTSGDYNAIQTMLESQDTAHLAYGTSSAKAVTLSFWVKVSQTGTMQFNLLHYADAGVRQISYLYTIDAADTWEKKTVTFAGDTTRIGDDDNSKGLVLEWFLSSYGGRTGSDVLTSWGAYTNAARFEGATISIGDSTSDTWQIAGVQLEVGSTATDFEHRSYGEELALCERYFQTYVAGEQEWIYCEGTAVTHKWWQVRYRNMRATPTFSASSAYTGVTSGNVGGGDIVSLAANSQLNRASIRVTVTSSSGTAHGIHHIDAWAGDSCYFDAEL